MVPSASLSSRKLRRQGTKADWSPQALQGNLGSENAKIWASEMVQWVEGLATKPDALRLLVFLIF